MTAPTSFRRFGKALAALVLLGAALLLPAGNVTAGGKGDACAEGLCSIIWYYADDSTHPELIGEYTRDENGVCTGWGSTSPYSLEGGYLCAP